MNFFSKMILLALIYTLCRLLFLLFNLNSFPVVYFTDFLAGFWFDLVTVAIVFLPFGAVVAFPNKWRSKKWFKISANVLFQIITFLTILPNLIDIIYFQFAGSRSTSGLITMLGFGNDLKQQLPSFFTDYWYLFLLLLVTLLFSIWGYQFIDKKIKDDSENVSWIKQLIYLPIVMGLLVLIGRGGLGLRPIAPAKAASYTIEQNIPLILNSTFTIIKTWGTVSLEEKEYFKEDELKKIFSPIRQYSGAELAPNTNVVILVLESFSVEYIASINGTKNVYTPFLDSLINQSLVFTNCYANGKKSIDAMPSIASSLPKLMELEYLTSQYASNRIESIPKKLHELNYNSSFFHGATNGTMSFDVFCDVAGYQNYIGRNEYNNENEFDGTWGIFDEPFLKFTAEELNKFQQPFFTTVFTISSHPPYAIPEQHQSKFNQGPEKVHDAVRYADYALQQFFETAKKMPWYNNTLFVIVADHTPASGTDIYYKDMGNMHIPLVFYHPTNNLFKGKNDKVVSQADIFPTLMDLIGYEKPFYSFGKSVFDSLPGYSASFIGNKYLYFADYLNEHYMLTYQDENPVGLYNLNDQLQTTNLIEKDSLVNNFVRNLKALIQTYNHALISNQMVIE